MIELTECLEKHREDELKFKQLTEVWKNGGLEAARMLAEKLVPTQSIRDLLVKFGIPTKMFLED